MGLSVISRVIVGFEVAYKKEIKKEKFFHEKTGEPYFKDEPIIVCSHPERNFEDEFFDFKDEDDICEVTAPSPKVLGFLSSN
jgi:hypothetical protein